jgi:hypothetical protein
VSARESKWNRRRSRNETVDEVEMEPSTKSKWNRRRSRNGTVDEVEMKPSTKSKWNRRRSRNGTVDEVEMEPSTKSKWNRRFRRRNGTVDEVEMEPSISARGDAVLKWTQSTHDLTGRRTPRYQGRPLLSLQLMRSLMLWVLLSFVGLPRARPGRALIGSPLTAPLTAAVAATDAPRSLRGAAG